MKNYKNNAKSLFTILIVGIALASCSSNNSDAIEIASQASDQTAIELTETQFQSSAMQLGKMENQAFHQVVKANGMFAVPPENLASTSSYFGGTVKSILLMPGEHVKKGQTLFVLENPDFVQMQQDYLEAKGQLTYLQSDYERQKNLAQDNVTSQKNFLKSESDYNVNRVKLESIGKKLELMNINPSTLTMENMRSTINVLSPFDGYVTSVNITRGAYLSPTQEAVTIINTDHLHLELNIFETDLPKVHIGQTIQFSIQEDKSRTYEATIYLINKIIDPKHRTIGIHADLANDSLTKLFAPGMYVEATIYATTDSKPALPAQAVVEMDDKFYVLMLEDSTKTPYTFVQREVKVGVSNPDFIEILNAKDFNTNAQFLTNGAFNLIKD